jgi:hypothetical protein
MLTNATILTAYIRANNALTLAWVNEDPANRGACVTVEDAAHWAEYGIYTIAQYNRNDTVSFIWDLYKDVHGFRPRSIKFDVMTDAQLDTMQQELLNYQRQQQEQSDYEQDAFDAYHSHAEEIEPEMNASAEDIAEDYIITNGW